MQSCAILFSVIIMNFISCLLNIWSAVSTICDHIGGYINATAWSATNICYILISDEINKLQEPDRTILKMHYFLDKTQSEIATYLGINQVQVSRIETKVLKKMKKNMSSLVNRSVCTHPGTIPW